jgi:hypothetical protein
MDVAGYHPAGLSRRIGVRHESIDPARFQTVSGKGFLLILRLYGPLEPWFDQTWRPGTIEVIP